MESSVTDERYRRKEGVSSVKILRRERLRRSLNPFQKIVDRCKLKNGVSGLHDPDS